MTSSSIPVIPISRPFDTGAYASSTTYISGTAVKKASEKIAEQIRERAALMLELDEWAGIRLQNRHAIASDGRSVSMEDIALHSLHQDQQRQLMATASLCQLRFSATFCRTICRSRSRYRDRTSHRNKAGHGCRCRCSDQSHHGQRASGRGHDPGSGLRPL